MSSALAHANAVLAGWYIGGCEIEACKRDTRRAAVLGIGGGVGVAGIFAFFSKPIVGLFTDNPDMIWLVGILLIVDVFWSLDGPPIWSTALP